jgi:hypothetical protein
MAYSIQKMADKIEASVSGPAALRYLAERLITESYSRSIFTQIEAARMAAELRRRANSQEGK